MIIIKDNGTEQNFNAGKILKLLRKCVDIQPKLNHVDVDKVFTSVQDGLGTRMKTQDLLKYVSECCSGLTLESFDYALMAGRVETVQLLKEVPPTFTQAMLRVKDQLHPEFLSKIETFDYDAHIMKERDYQYDIIGLRTLKKSYLIKDEKGYVECPQYMLMRVAVFLCDTPEEAISTYKIMSEGYYTHASPTLFHSGLKNHQLASCFLVEMQDDSISGIYDTLKTVALISKSAGGIGLSISNIRASGSSIAGTGGTSNGIVPMLRVFNHTAKYVDQGGGKRKGSFAIFMEPWHLDLPKFLELKLNHGVEDERCRDLFYSLWIPDLFMKRIKENGVWSLFCPRDVPELQDKHSEEFEKAYLEAEEKKLYKVQISAQELWGKILTSTMETGTPYLMYKDACNKKSNQQHLGTIKQSNLCAEIVEYTSKNEIAVCTLASIALPKFVENGTFNFEKLVSVSGKVTKMLNHVIDKTSYPVEAAERSNTRHRPIAIGVNGLSDVFNMLNMAYDSEDAKYINQHIFEAIYYGAVSTSVDLAAEHGPYETFKGSPSSTGRLQFDLWNYTPSRYDWAELKLRLTQHGMRNSLLTGCMPTASSAQILGNTESMEPRTSNMFVRRVLSGEFMIVNKYLEAALREKSLWTPLLVQKIIKNRGSVQNIKEIPQEIRAVYKTVWEISQKHLIDLSADRAVYIDQSQSLNLYQAQPTMSKLSSMAFYAWKKGLKTGQYYLRTLPKVNAVAFTVKNTVKKEEEEEEVCLSCSS